MLQDLKKATRLYRYKKKVIVAVLLILAAAIAVMMFFAGYTLRDRLMDDSKARTQELAEVIELSLHHLMLVRSPEKIQQTLGLITTRGSSVVKAFIIDNKNKVVYSSRMTEIGFELDRFSDPACSGCHKPDATLPGETTTIIKAEGEELLRSVNIIYNEESCHACHPPSDKTNGKLIIDQSTRPTYVLIAAVESILAIFGIFILAVLAPFLSRIVSKGIDTYINEILFKSKELSLLYMIVERLSKTLEIEDLKRVVIGLAQELYNADEIHIILPKDSREYGGIVWRRAGNRIERRGPPDEDPYRELIRNWFQGVLDGVALFEKGSAAYLPLAKGGVRLGLIIVKRSDRRFDEHDIDLIRAMGSHIAVALENAALYHIAITDDLTGLYSKRHFRTIIEKKFKLYEKYGEKMTLLILDIDDFKKVNDTYGHPAGDIVLRETARRIQNATREEDLDFRYGGEEFIVLLSSMDSSEGVNVAERIREQICSRPFNVGEQELRITLSIGVASIPEHAETVRGLVSEADKALYEAKKTGKNRVVRKRVE